MKRGLYAMVLGTLVLSLTVGPLMAGPSTAELFKAMDKNGDGKVTAQEYIAACQHDNKKCSADFKWYDRNADGVLTLPEYEGKVKQ
jgi:Ca2+-binding EF-hand superfamily protein